MISFDAHSPGGYSVGWFTLSLINAGLAESKGRGRLNWWLLSLILGPLATLYIVVTESRFND
jgi:hypothetical protein